MSSKIHLIMPMGGAGSRFTKNGMYMPKPLIELQGRPFLYWSAQSVMKYVDTQDITFVILKDHVDRFSIDKEIKRWYPEAKTVVIPRVLDGAVLTCLEGVKDIDDDLPIVFNDCDHMFTCREFYDFCRAGDFSAPDGALLTFESDEPLYSFLECDDEGNVIRTVEKVAISTHAICGAYYFRNKEVFSRAALQYLDECSYEEFFVSGVYNIMAANGEKISYFKTDIHIPFGVPSELKTAEKDERIREVEA